MAGNFNAATRQKFANLSVMTKPSGGGQTQGGPFLFPRVGLGARLYINIRGSISGSLSGLNALGKAAIVKNVSVKVNNSLDVINISGAGYHYLVRDHLDSGYTDAGLQSDARDAVATGAYNLDMVLPLALNPRDSIGLLMLQNEQTTVNVAIEWETDANVATGATVTGTATPRLEYFTLPADPEDWPPVNMVHQLIEDQNAVTSGVDFTYNWLRGNTYLGVYHGLGIGATGADSWTRARWVVQQSDTILDIDPNFQDLQFRQLYGRVRELGTIPLDLLATSGLGSFGLARDTLNSQLLTDCKTIITPSATTTLYTVRRQLVLLQ